MNHVEACYAGIAFKLKQAIGVIALDWIRLRSPLLLRSHVETPHGVAQPAQAHQRHRQTVPQPEAPGLVGFVDRSHQQHEVGVHLLRPCEQAFLQALTVYLYLGALPFLLWGSQTLIPCLKLRSSILMAISNSAIEPNVR